MKTENQIIENDYDNEEMKTMKKKEESVVLAKQLLSVVVI